MTAQLPIVFQPRSYSGLEQFHALYFPDGEASKQPHFTDAVMKDSLDMTARVLDGALEAAARTRDSIQLAERPNAAVSGYLTAVIDQALRERLDDALGERKRIPRVTEEHFRVLMMGRTQAGKSTLLEVLTEGDGSRIGDGRQRFTRDVHERPMSELPGVVLVDTPGVGARDGAEDFKLAFAQVADADLVLWVGNDNPGQEDTTRALQLIALLGKPVVVVLNCHRDLNPAHKYADFISDPDWAFSQVDEHFEWIAQLLAESGHRPVAEFAVHADAAHRAARDASHADAETLRRHSRVAPLVAAIDAERTRQSRSRRVIRKANLARRPLELSRLELLIIADQLNSTVDLQRKQLEDLERRVGRVIDKHGEAMKAETRTPIGAKRTWHLSAPADRSAEQRWSEEAGRLHKQLIASLKRNFTNLQAEVEETIRRVDAEWASVPEASGLRDLPDFDSVWLNRFGRIAFKGGGTIGGAALGGWIGGALGGPVGAVIGAGLGAVLLGGVGDWLSDKWERLFHSQAEIEKKRRDRMGRQVQEILDQYQAAVDGVIDDALAQVSDRTRDEIEAQRVQLVGPEDVALDFRERASTLRDGRVALDLATVQDLLVLADRSATADLVRHAWRLPGVAICVTVDPAVFSEVGLFGADSAERIAVLPDSPTGLSPTSAAQLMLGLTDAEFVLETTNTFSARIRLPDLALHDAELRALGDFMTEVLGGAIQVGGTTNHRSSDEKGDRDDGD